jgi:hypothetical protein
MESVRLTVAVSDQPVELDVGVVAAPNDPSVVSGQWRIAQDVTDNDFRVCRHGTTKSDGR